MKWTHLPQTTRRAQRCSYLQAATNGVYYTKGGRIYLRRIGALRMLSCLFVAPTVSMVPFLPPTPLFSSPAPLPHPLVTPTPLPNLRLATRCHPKPYRAGSQAGSEHPSRRQSWAHTESIATGCCSAPCRGDHAPNRAQSNNHGSRRHRHHTAPSSQCYQCPHPGRQGTWCRQPTGRALSSASPPHVPRLVAVCPPLPFVSFPLRPVSSPLASSSYPPPLSSFSPVYARALSCVAPRLTFSVPSHQPLPAGLPLPHHR